MPIQSYGIKAIWGGGERKGQANIYYLFNIYLQ